MDQREGKDQTAVEALSSAKSAHKRIDALEVEVKDINNLTAAMAAVNVKVDHLKTDVTDIKTDVKKMSETFTAKSETSVIKSDVAGVRDDIKKINARPGMWTDKIIAAIIGAIASGVVAAILNAVFR